MKNFFNVVPWLNLTLLYSTATMILGSSAALSSKRSIDGTVCLIRANIRIRNGGLSFQFIPLASQALLSVVKRRPVCCCEVSTMFHQLQVSTMFHQLQIHLWLGVSHNTPEGCGSVCDRLQLWPKSSSCGAGGPAGSMEGGRQAEIAKAILGAKNVPYIVAAPLLIQVHAARLLDLS